MKKWPAKDAKTRFNDLLDACLANGPQMVTRRGVEAVVLVPAEQWHRLQATSRPSLKELLLSDAGRAELQIPTRGSARRRRVASFG